MDMNRQEWKEKAAEMSGVPKDVAMGLPILTITGTNLGDIFYLSCIFSSDQAEF